jgi:nucleotide-binding universal stress UspA family protein
MSPTVIAAFDGSAGANRALEWAADDAARQGVPLRIVHVLAPWPYDISKYTVQGGPDEFTAGAGRMLAGAEETARKRHPGLEVSSALLEGPPAKVLSEQSAADTTIVLGSRGLGGFVGALVGSVSTSVATHSHGPVVVVRPHEGVARNEVVVGVDDSPESEPALEYALNQARLRGATLRAIHAWQLPVHAYAPEVTFDMDEVVRHQQRLVADRLRAWREKYPDVTVHEQSPCVHPATALIEASSSADRVVVGSRGMGAIGSIVLGSVSRAVLHHAHSPVAVVRS